MTKKMNIKIETSGTIAGTSLEIDGVQVPHIQAFSIVASVVDGVHFELRYWGEGSIELARLGEHPMVSLKAFEETASAKLDNCASVWRRLSKSLPPIVQASGELKRLNELLLDEGSRAARIAEWDYDQDWTE